MKHLIMAITLALPVMAVKGQEVGGSKTPALMPASHDMGFSLNVNGLINSISLSPVKDDFDNPALIFRYYSKETLALRVGFGLNSWNLKFSTVDSIGNTKVEWDSTYKRADVFVVPGIEKHIAASERLDVYLALLVPFGKRGTERMKITTAVSDTSGTAKTVVDGWRTGNGAFGIRAITGFNLFLTRRLAIGAEYGIGFDRSSFGGDWEMVTVTTPVSGTPTTKREIGSSFSTDTGLSVSSSAGISLSWFFGLPRKEEKAEGSL